MTATERAMCTEAEDRIRELEVENQRLRGRDADADALGERLGEMERELHGVRLVARQVLDLRSSYDADRGVDTKLVSNLQAREMLHRIALASDENCNDGETT